MSGWVAQLIATSGLLVASTQSAFEYIKTLPPMPDQSAIECHDAAWEQSTLVTVNDMKVHKKLAPHIERMFSNGKANGVYFRITSAYRSCTLQNQLRALACGTGDYNMNIKPIEDCSPPTEPAGRSLHNEGLAVDLECTGYGQFVGSPCYRWLKSQSFRYHIYEHRLEPWHWSTTGK